MVATDTRARWQHALAALRRAGLCTGLLAAGAAQAVDLPEDRAEALLHVYSGGGVRASGPAVLVRKNLAGKVSLSASHYVDMVSNASIDVVTTASPFRETRHANDLGLDYVTRDTRLTLGLNQSTEPDYRARTLNVNATQDVFGGMSTVSLGFSRSADKVGKKGDVGWFDSATHWQYRAGLTQILTPRLLATANFEAVADTGYLGSPYRVARVFGAAVPERVPRTRSSRALKLGVVGAYGERSSLRADYRYFWDTWAIKAHTLELGGSRHLVIRGQPVLADAYVRLYSQGRALFYSDNAPTETTYVSRNRQLGAFNSFTLGAKASWLARKVEGSYEMKLNAAYEMLHFRYSDFTDLRTGAPYSFTGHVLQAYVSATF